MARKILRVYLQRVLVHSNGIPPTWDDGKAHNLIVATLLYPRSGAPSVASAKEVRLQNETPFTSDPTATVWDRLIFKEEVDDETELRIKVMYRSNSAKAEDFLKKLLGLGATVAGSLLGAIGLIGVVVGWVIGEVVDEIKHSGPESLLLGQTDLFRSMLATRSWSRSPKASRIRKTGPSPISHMRCGWSGSFCD